MNGMIQEANRTQVQSAGKRAPSTIKEYIVAMKSGIAAALPSVMTPERFTRIALSAVSNNPKLQKCSSQSFLAAMMTAAQLGLEPNTPLGQAYLIPYWNHGQLECQFQLGYKGLIDLAYRSGQVSTIQAETVYQNDKFEYAFGLEPKLVHVPAAGDRGDPVAYWAMFKMKDGGFGYSVMSMQEVRSHAQRYSKSYSSGPWQTNFDEMAKKTVLKRALKYAPLASDFVKGMSADETVKTELAEDMSDVVDVTAYSDDQDPGVDPETGEVVRNA